MAIVTNTLNRGGGGGTSITVVANYSALPDPTTVSGEFYWAEASQGTSWLPGSLGGTYYNSGMYYSNGVSWTFMNVPYQATQAEVNTGTNTDKFVTPSTLSNSTWAFTTAKVLATVLSGFSASAGTVTSSDSILTAFNKIVGNISLKADKDRCETFVFSKSNGTFGSHTGNTAETVLLSITVSANEYAIGDFLTLYNSYVKVGVAGAATLRVRMGTAGTTADALVATAILGITGLNMGFERTQLHFITGNKIKGYNNSQNSPSDVNQSTIAVSETTLDPTASFKITYTVQLVNGGDTLSLINYQVGKIKTF